MLKAAYNPQINITAWVVSIKNLILVQPEDHQVWKGILTLQGSVRNETLIHGMHIYK